MAMSGRSESIQSRSLAFEFVQAFGWLVLLVSVSRLFQAPMGLFWKLATGLALMAVVIQVFSVASRVVERGMDSLRTLWDSVGDELVSTRNRPLLAEARAAFERVNSAPEFAALRFKVTQRYLAEKTPPAELIVPAVAVLVRRALPGTNLETARRLAEVAMEEASVCGPTAELRNRLEKLSAQVEGLRSSIAEISRRAESLPANVSQRPALLLGSSEAGDALESLLRDFSSEGQLAKGLSSVAQLRRELMLELSEAERFARQPSASSSMKARRLTQHERRRLMEIGYRGLSLHN